MRLAIDAMGNDKGPSPIVRGVALFLQRDREAEVVLVGDRARLLPLLEENGLREGGRIEIVHASQVLEMHEKVAGLREKRDSSIVRLVETLKAGKADAMVALGNTAAAVGATCIGLGHIQGARRAGIAVPLPTRTGRPCVAIDMGANTAVKAKHLLAYGVMASVYAERVLHVPEPRVGLLNVGEEVGKGNDFLREAYGLLEQAPIRFVGNVEGSDFYSGNCDVVVCDGFVGNVVLKTSESLASTIAQWLKESFRSSLITKMGALLARSAFAMLRQRTDYARYGGAPLLGVDGICIIGHGKSNPDAVSNALRVAAESVAVRLNEVIRESLARTRENVRAQETEPICE